MSHLTDGQLHAFLDGSVEDLADAEPPDVRSHVEGCADCRARLEAARLVRDRAHSLLRVAAPPSLAPPPIQELARARTDRPPGPRVFGPRPESLAWAATIAVALTGGWLARGMIDTETAGRFAELDRAAGAEQLAGEGAAAKMARVSAAAAVPADGPPGWVPVDRARAETLLGGRLRTVGGLPILSIFARDVDVEGTPVVWTAQQLASGHTLNLRQSPVEVSDVAQERDAVRANRKIDDAAEAEGLASFESVERIRLGGFLIEARAPLSPDSLRSLLSRLEG